MGTSCSGELPTRSQQNQMEKLHERPMFHRGTKGQNDDDLWK